MRDFLDSFRLPFAGFGFLIIWSMLIMYNYGGVVVSPSDGLMYIATNNATSIGIIVCTSAVTALCWKSDRIRKRMAWCLGATVLGVAGTVLILFGSDSLRLVGFAVAGLGNGWLLVSWGDVYARMSATAAEGAAVGAAVGNLLVALLVSLLPVFGRIAILLLLVPLSTLGYFASLRQLAMSGESDADATATSLPCSRALIARICVGLGVPIAVVYLLFGSRHALFLMGSGSEDALILGLVVFAVAYLLFIRLAPGLDLASIARVLLGFSVFIILADVLNLGSFLSGACCYGAAFLSQYLLMVYGARLFRSGFGNIVFTFGLVQLVNAVFSLLGGLAGYLAIGGGDASEAAILHLWVFVLALSFAAVLVIQRSPTDAFRPTDHNGGAGVTDTRHLVEIAERFNLTPRETEVFLLLAAGQSAPLIRDELTISLSTVKSHVKHIYEKMDVHTRQEFLRIIYTD